MIKSYAWTDQSSPADRAEGYVLDMPEPGWLWVDIRDEGPAETAAVVERLGLDPDLVSESLSPASHPWMEEHGDVIHVVVQGFATGTGDRMASLGLDVFMGQRFLLTVHEGELASVEEMRDRCETSPADVSASSPGELFGQVALTAARRVNPLVAELERRLEELEESAIQGDPQTVVEVHALRRDVIYMRRILGPQHDVFEDLAEVSHPAVPPAARRAFQRVTTQHKRALESLEAARALLATVLETYRGAQADETNEIMRVLTVFSAILLPLTLIAGVWGMNFARIPGSDITDGFWWLVGAMAVLGVGVWLYFSRRGFIGAPRLRDLPKAVGLGLFTIGTAPIRVVTEGIRQLGRTEDTDG